MAENLDETQLAEQQWERYVYCRDDRGHLDYIKEARKLERYYIGSGGQWEKAAREYLEKLNRPVIELNECFSAINTAVGEQIGTRVDLTFFPKESISHPRTAEVLTKIIRQICADQDYHQHETQMFADGLIQRRGYLDFRITFDRNLKGTATIESLDPLDVIPDPDAQSYDPRTWRDVTVTRWLTLDDIEGLYGDKARKKVEAQHFTNETKSWGDEASNDNDEQGRNAFGTSSAHYYDSEQQEKKLRRVRIIDRQHKTTTQMLHFWLPDTGDLKPCLMETEEAQAYADKNGYKLIKLKAERIRWTVSTQFCILHDDWSPYQTYTVIPYFPYFRRGKTIGFLDNAISPQDLINKSTSSYLHIINSVANSGWKIKKNSLKNMTVSQLEQAGAKTGLVLELDQLTDAEKIQPNVPQAGLMNLSGIGGQYVHKVTGMNEAEQGLRGGSDPSARLEEFRAFKAKLQLSYPFDNLTLTRKLVARKLLELVQQFYTEERCFFIIGKDLYGKRSEEPVWINAATPTGEILNDITVGIYDVEIATQPVQATFEKGQFEQAVTLRKELGVAIPDEEIIRLSNLANKEELAKRIAQGDPEVQETRKQMAMAQLRNALADAALKEVKVDNTIADTTVKNVTGQFSAVQTGRLLTQDPRISALADILLGSAGYKDHDKPPIIPETQGEPTPQPPMPQSTSPMFPAQADRGILTGMERIQG